MNQQYVLDSSIDSRNIMQLLNDSSFAMDPVSVLPSTSDQQHQSMLLHFDDVQSTSTSKFSLPLSQHMQPFNIASSVSVSSGAPSSSSSVTVTGAVAQSKTSVSSNKRDRQELNKKKKQNVTTTKKQLQQHKLQQAAFNATKHEAISMAIAKQEEEKTILLPQVEGITTSQPAIVNPGKEIDVAVNEFPLNSVVSSSSSMYGVGELEIVNDEWKYKDNDYFNFEFIVAVKEQRRIGSARSGKKSTPQASSITVRARGPCVPKSAALKATLFNFGAAVDNKRRLVNPDNSNGSPLVELRKGIDIGCADNIALFSPTADKYGWRYATMKCCITRGARVQCRKNHIALKLEVIDVDENHIEIPKNYEYIQSANDSDSDDVEACDEPTKKKRSKIRLTLPNAVPVQAFPWIRTARISVSEKAMCPRECDKRRLLEQAMKERTKLTNMNFPIFDRVQTPSHPFMQQYNSEPNETQGAFFNELNFNNSNFINIQSNNDEDGKNKRRKLDRIMSGRDLMVSPSIKIAKQKKESTTDSPPTAIAILSMPDVNFPAQFGVGPSAESASKPLTIADKSHRFTRNSFADLDELGVPNVDASELLANLMARRQSYAFPPFQDQQQSYPTSMASNVYNQSHAFSANKSNFPAPAIELGSRMNGLRRLSIQIPDQFQSNIQNQIIPTGLDSSLVDRRISDIFEHQTFPSSAPPILFGRSSLFINEQGNEVSIMRSPLVAPQQANINMEGNSFQMLPSELSFLLQQDDESF